MLENEKKSYKASLYFFNVSLIFFFAILSIDGGTLRDVRLIIDKVIINKL